MFIQPDDVIYFVHDSASYMSSASERLIDVLGYNNLGHLPGWAHITNLIGCVVFDKKVLPEVNEFLRFKRPHVAFALFCLKKSSGYMWNNGRPRPTQADPGRPWTRKCHLP